MKDMEVLALRAIYEGVDLTDERARKDYLRRNGYGDYPDLTLWDHETETMQ